MAHVTHMHESWHTHERVMKFSWNIPMKHCILKNEMEGHVAWYNSQWAHFWEFLHRSGFAGSCSSTARVSLAFDSFMCVTCPWLIHVCGMSHIWMSHPTHMNQSCHTHEWVMAFSWNILMKHCILEWSFWEIFTQVGLCRQLLEYGESIFGIYDVRRRPTITGALVNAVNADVSIYMYVCRCV